MNTNVFKGFILGLITLTISSYFLLDKSNKLQLTQKEKQITQAEFVDILLVPLPRVSPLISASLLAKVNFAPGLVVPIPTKPFY